MRGVVQGKYFNLTPLPPPPDVLGNPLVVPDLPTRKLPRENWRSRLGRVLSRLHLGSQSAVMRQRWKLQDAIASAVASVSASAAMGTARGAGGRSSVPVVIVRHPYHLRHIFDLLPQIPDALAPERRFLELLASRILRKYGEHMSLVKGSPFSFEHESKEYFYAGFRLERHMKNISSPDEHFSATQNIYNAYFHGRNYYCFALLRREKLNPDNKLFMLYARACYFMARIDWSGQLQDKPVPRLLPKRDELMFYLQRDKTVLQRYRSDPDYQRQVKSVLEAFPD
ncbi:hypothetical protein [Azospirillum halopraeferens]|uniref:hypothetical protein n=1 Tax=Azospirillum halopraeferens TaxID=34010 RepID=UPI0004257B06|nr:hypothetical protein [Azospirillum halopraeferens]